MAFNSPFVTGTRVPSVLIVILNWNSLGETEAALQSVRAMEYSNFRVLVVDNGSRDGSNVELRRWAGDRIEILESPANVGYTGGCNFGIERALEMNADYVWLLNNDALVEPGTLASLVELAESDTHIGLVSPQIGALDQNRLTFAGGVISLKRKLYEETNDPAVAAEWKERYPTAGLVIGTAMLVRVELARRIGVLDSTFFAYFEDIDYSLRSAAAGYRNVIDARTTVRHLEKNRNTQPFEIKPHYWYYMARNESRFWRKHLGLWGSLRLRWYSFNGFMRHYNRLNAKEQSRNAILAGLWHGWLNRGGEYSSDFRMPNMLVACVKLYSQRPALRRFENVSQKEEVLSRA